MRIFWKYKNVPAYFSAARPVHSIWCPRWLQPLVLWALRKFDLEPLL